VYRRRLAVVIVLACAAMTVMAVPAVSGAPHKSVRIFDYDFGPKHATVTKGTRVTWRWAKSNQAPHNVHVTKAPDGVKHFTGGGKNGRRHAKPFTRTLRKVGTYRFVCQIHPFMKMRIKVTR
jgi:plastocyanin